jgi:hypothetical protein
MSGYTQSNTEALFSYAGASTNLATFTTEANLLQTYPLVQIPAAYFGLGAGAGANARSLRVRAGGLCSSTASPTFTLFMRAIAANPAWSAGGLLLGQTNAMTGSNATLGSWVLDADITLRTSPIAAGTATIVTMGTVVGNAFTLPESIPAANTSPALATWSVDITAYYFYLSASCGTSSGSNLINCQYLKIYGDN